MTPPPPSPPPRPPPHRRSRRGPVRSDGGVGRGLVCAAAEHRRRSRRPVRPSAGRRRHDRRRPAAAACRRRLDVASRRGGGAARRACGGGEGGATRRRRRAPRRRRPRRRRCPFSAAEGTELRALPRALAAGRRRGARLFAARGSCCACWSRSCKGGGGGGGGARARVVGGRGVGDRSTATAPCSSCASRWRRRTDRPTLRALGVGWLGAGDQRGAIEAAAKTSFQRNRDPHEAALYYLASVRSRRCRRCARRCATRSCMDSFRTTSRRSDGDPPR